MHMKSILGLAGCGTMLAISNMVPVKCMLMSQAGDGTFKISGVHDWHRMQIPRRSLNLVSDSILRTASSELRPQLRGCYVSQVSRRYPSESSHWYSGPTAFHLPALLSWFACFIVCLSTQKSQNNQKSLFGHIFCDTQSRGNQRTARNWTHQWTRKRYRVTN